MQFSPEEIRDLIKAWFAVSLAIASAILGFDTLSTLGIPVLIRAFAIYSLTVGISFIAHEIFGHKFLAQRYHLFAEFRADDLLLLLAVLFSFTGFVFAAPGAVVIGGVTRVNTYGKVAAAGPLVNILLALFFGFMSRAGLALVLPLYNNQGIDLIATSYQINAWLALFNLIPLGILDGAKVMAWNKKVWLVLIAIAGSLFFGII